MNNETASVKVLVIGGAGFIGRNLCDYLIESGYQVQATSRFLDRVATENNRVEWLKLDLSNESDLDLHFSGIECVIFLAGRAHIHDATGNSLDAYRRINCYGAIRVARQASEQNVRRFIYISSIGVNGIESSTLFNESDEPNPQEPYSVSKLEAENSLKQACHDASMELVILRPPLVYGNQAPGNFGRLVNAVSKGFFFPLGGITNERSLIGIDNLVQLIEICIRHPDAANQLFLVSDGDDVSTPGLITLIGESISKPARLISVPGCLLRLAAFVLGKRQELNRLSGSLLVDNSKARNILGWKPKLSLEQGLKKLEQKSGP